MVYTGIHVYTEGGVVPYVLEFMYYTEQLHVSIDEIVHKGLSYCFLYVVFWENSIQVLCYMY